MITIDTIDTFFLELALAVAGKWKLLDAAIIFLGKYFQWPLVLLFVVLVVARRKKWLPFLLSSASAVILSRLVIVELIRFLWHRDRPFVEYEFTPLIAHNPAASFPSAHAAFDFALASVVYAYNRKLGILFFAGSALVAFSRVFAGVHWFSDILAGAFIGILSGWIVVHYGKGLLRKFNVQ